MDFWRIQRFRMRWSGYQKGYGGSVKRVLESGFDGLLPGSNGCLVELITQAPVWISPVIVMCCWSASRFFCGKGGRRSSMRAKKGHLGNESSLCRRNSGEPRRGK